MLIPTFEVDKFLKAATNEQICLARINYLLYKRCGFVFYWFLEQLQLAASAASMESHDLFSLKIDNSVESLSQISVYATLKGAKSISELELLFQVVTVTRMKFFGL